MRLAKTNIVEFYHPGSHDFVIIVKLCPGSRVDVSENLKMIYFCQFSGGIVTLIGLTFKSQD